MHLWLFESKKMQRGFTIVSLGRIADALGLDIRELLKPVNEKDPINKK